MTRIRHHTILQICTPVIVRGMQMAGNAAAVPPTVGAGGPPFRKPRRQGQITASSNPHAHRHGESPKMESAWNANSVVAPAGFARIIGIGRGAAPVTVQTPATVAAQACHAPYAIRSRAESPICRLDTKRPSIGMT